MCSLIAVSAREFASSSAARLMGFVQSNVAAKTCV